MEEYFALVELFYPGEELVQHDLYSEEHEARLDDLFADYEEYAE